MCELGRAARPGASCGAARRRRGGRTSALPDLDLDALALVRVAVDLGGDEQPVRPAAQLGQVEKLRLRAARRHLRAQPVELVADRAVVDAAMLGHVAREDSPVHHLQVGAERVRERGDALEAPPLRHKVKVADDVDAGAEGGDDGAGDGRDVRVDVVERHELGLLAERHIEHLGRLPAQDRRRARHAHAVHDVGEGVDLADAPVEGGDGPDRVARPARRVRLRAPPPEHRRGRRLGGRRAGRRVGLVDVDRELERGRALARGDHPRRSAGGAVRPAQRRVQRAAHAQG